MSIPIEWYILNVQFQQISGTVNENSATTTCEDLGSFVSGVSAGQRLNLYSQYDYTNYIEYTVATQYI